MYLKKGFLGDVLGIGSISTAPHGKSENPVAVVLIELLETPVFTIGEGIDEGLVRIGE
jgi:hypothetical protein